MATSKKPARPKPAAGKSKPGAEAAGRSTGSSPAARDSVPGDPQAQQAADQQAMAAAMPFNENKAREYERRFASSPPEGGTVKAPSFSATGSTLSEVHENDKTGAPATEGGNPTVDPLDRVRVDASGQRLTTNQAVPVGDNQHSLKAGLRGPTLP